MQNIVNLAVVVIIRYLQAIKNHEVRRNQNIETNFGEIRISFQIKIRRSLVDAPVFVINWIFVVEYNVLVARGNIKITKTGQILRPQENLKAGQNQLLDRPGQVLGATEWHFSFETKNVALIFYAYFTYLCKISLTVN